MTLVLLVASINSSPLTVGVADVAGVKIGVPNILVFVVDVVPMTVVFDPSPIAWYPMAISDDTVTPEAFVAVPTYVQFDAVVTVVVPSEANRPASEPIQTLLLQLA